MDKIESAAVPNTQFKVAINGRFLGRRISGVERYASEVMRALDGLLERKINKHFELTLLIPRNVSAPAWLKRIKSKNVGVLSGHLWEQFELPIYSRDATLISFCNTGPIFHKRQIVCIHDANTRLLPQNYSIPFKLLYRLLEPIIGYTALKIVTDSQFSMEMLVQYKIASPHKIMILYAGKEHIERVLDTENNERVKKPYVLLVGGMSKNKNLSIILDIAEELSKKGIKVAVVGSVGSDVFTSTRWQDLTNVLELGPVNDESLVQLYKNAHCLAFPSIYEGFGLPPIEAMALGCPVVSSNTSSLSEVCGEGALFADPHNSSEWLEAILILQDPKIRSDKIKAGLENAAKFCWDDVAAGYLSLISS